MSDVNLLYTDIEDDLRSTVREVLADRCDPVAISAVYDGDRSVVAGLWKTLATDLGLAALLVPEERGGAGASAREAAVVLEELGRAVAPVPFLTSAVVATTLLTDSETRLVEDLASGDRVASLVVPLSIGPGSAIPTLPVEDGRLRGTVTSVAGALEADVLIVPSRVGSEIVLYAVPAVDATVSAVVSLDMSRQLADVTFHVAVGEPVLVDAEPAIRHALEVGAGLLASEQLGVAQWCLEATVAYLKERKQFGRVVGGFQALKHRLADLATSVDSAGAAARYAAATIAAGDKDILVATAVAQAFCSGVAVLAAEEAIQLHAGIGMTWEHPAHLYLKRAKADQIALGVPGMHRARLADLVGLPGSS
jgi:alkylation response protein AidB-like acyl-CoA dehydrogenase